MSRLLWTAITSRYLGIEPHTEFSWWAVRGQLVSNPGYMVNYAIGAILTAEMRKRTRDSIGNFDGGNSRWYEWTSDQLLKFGGELDTARLLDQFLGRPLSTSALVGEIASAGRNVPSQAWRREVLEQRQGTSRRTSSLPVRFIGGDRGGNLSRGMTRD